MKLLKDFDCSIFYHPGKVKIVGDALSRKSVGSLAHISTERKLMNKSCKLINQGLQLKVTKKCILSRFKVRLVYLDRVKAAQRKDSQLSKKKKFV